MGVMGQYSVAVKIAELALDTIPVAAGLVARVKAQVRARATVSAVYGDIDPNYINSVPRRCHYTEYHYEHYRKGYLRYTEHAYVQTSSPWCQRRHTL
jgi:hypothetical protein